MLTLKWRLLEVILRKRGCGQPFMHLRDLAYWCAIRLCSSDGKGGAFNGNPCERTVTDVLKSHNSWAR